MRNRFGLELARHAPRLAAAAALALGLASCGTLGSGGAVMGSNVPAAAPRVVGVQTPAQREHARILAAYGGAYQDERLQALLGGMASQLARASDDPEQPYRVTILNSPSVNAFALPTGDLYVTRGLVALSNDTSEVAAVLSHEMAHVTARHAFERADRERQAVLVSRVVTDVLSDPSAGALALAKSRIALARFSRIQELEADRIGARTLARAGYDPMAAARFLTAMGRNAELRARALGTASEAEAPDFLSTHPATPERVALVVETAREIGADPERSQQGRETLMELIDGVVYGDDPRQGLVRGRQFVHPVLGFTFTAPEGFTLENASDALVGVGPDGSALRLDAEPAGPLGTPEAVLAAGVVEGTRVEAVEPLALNGLPAVIGVARGREWSFRVAAVRVGNDIFRLVFAARELTPEVDARFQQAIASFRRLGPDEARKVRPLRVRVVQSRRGDTPATVARRMAGVDHPLERFLILNGIEANTPLPAGTKLKIVAE